LGKIHVSNGYHNDILKIVLHRVAAVFGHIPAPIDAIAFMDWTMTNIQSFYLINI
jgi:hypothetical protein